MSTYQYFKPGNCEGLIGLDVDEKDWPTTLELVKNKVAACLQCNPNCAIHMISQMSTHAEFMSAIKSGKIKPEIPEPEN